MKKVFTLLCLSLLTISCLNAQDNRLLNNTFFQLGGGIDIYGNDHNTASQIITERQIGYPSIDIAFGKWMLNAAAVRVGFTSMIGDNEYYVPNGGVIGAKTHPLTGTIGDSTGVATSQFFSGHVELLWDLISTFNGLKLDRPFNIYPMAGFGFVKRQHNSFTTHDSDFTALAGLSMDIRLHRDFFLYAEAKYFMFPQGYDRNEKLSNIIDLTLGLKYDIRRQEYRPRKYGEANSISDDWYFAIGAGANYSYTQNDGGSPAVLGELTVGKYFTTCASTRLQLGGGLMGVGNNTDTYASLHADMLLDLLNFCEMYLSNKHKNPALGRGFSPMLYAGAGVYDRFDVNKIKLGADAGCLFRFFLNRNADLYIDARMAMVPHLVSESSSSLGEYFPSITFGYIRNFGENTLR